MIETWHKIWCPKCDTPNWFNDGDTSDMTKSDLSGLRCFKCSHIWAIYEEETGDEPYEDECETGVARPI